MATQTQAPEAPAEEKVDKKVADLAKAFEKDGTMEQGYVYRYQTVPAGETVVTELVVEKRG